MGKRESERFFRSDKNCSLHLERVLKLLEKRDPTHTLAREVWRLLGSARHACAEKGHSSLQRCSWIRKRTRSRGTATAHGAFPGKESTLDA